MKTYVKYLDRTTDLTKLFVVENLVMFRPLMQSNITNPQGHYYFEDSLIDKLNQSRADIIKNAYNFYTDEFLVAVLNRENPRISILNTDQACEQLKGSFIDVESCEALAEGMMKRGFHVVVMNILQFLKNEEMFMLSTPVE